MSFLALFTSLSCGMSNLCSADTKAMVDDLLTDDLRELQTKKGNENNGLYSPAEKTYYKKKRRRAIRRISMDSDDNNPYLRFISEQQVRFSPSLPKKKKLPERIGSEKSSPVKGNIPLLSEKVKIEY